MQANDSWEARKQLLQSRWPALTDADLETTGGRREELVALLEGRLGYARSNAEDDVDQFLAGDLILPNDVADEDTHTGTSGPVDLGGRPSDAGTFRREAFRGDDGFARSEGARSEGGSSTMSNRLGPGQPQPGDTRAAGMAVPWRTAAMAALGVGGLAAALMAFAASRRERRRYLAIPLPTQGETARAAEAAGRAAGRTWDVIQPFASRVIATLAAFAPRLRVMYPASAARGFVRAYRH